MTKAAAIVFVGSLLAIPGEAQQAASITWEPFTFESPVIGQTKGERGWLEVPVRHRNPDGPKIRFLRGEPVRDESIAWPLSFRWPE